MPVNHVVSAKSSVDNCPMHKTAIRFGTIEHDWRAHGRHRIEIAGKAAGQSCRGSQDRNSNGLLQVRVEMGCQRESERFRAIPHPAAPPTS